jgi:hypothetical protein
VAIWEKQSKQLDDQRRAAASYKKLTGSSFDSKLKIRISTEVAQDNGAGRLVQKRELSSFSRSKFLLREKV